MKFLFVGDLRVDKAFPLREHLQTIGSIAPGAAVVGNLEIPLCSEEYGSPAEKAVPFRGEEGIAQSLREGNFAAVTLANNHSTSWGIGGLLRTRDVLEASGIGAIGAGETVGRALDAWCIRECGLAVVGVSAVVDIGMVAEERRAGVAGIGINSRMTVDMQRSVEHGEPSYSTEWRFGQAQLGALERKIAGLTEQGLAVIVFLHWGKLFSPEIETWEMAIAERLISAGAKLLVGCHSHTVGPIAEYRGATVAFALGNWAWSPNLIRGSAERIEGHASRLRRWSRVSLALIVEVVEGEVVSWAPVPLVFDRTIGIAIDALDLAEREMVAAVVRWLSVMSVAEREGWSEANVWPQYAVEFPFGYVS